MARRRRRPNGKPTSRTRPRRTGLSGSRGVRFPALNAKTIAQGIIPARAWTMLRLWRLRRRLARYPVRRVRHEYASFPLTLELSDPLAEGWYDHEWPEPGEIAVLRGGQLRPGARVFDLGAHQGVHALILARLVGPAGRVVAVEANPHEVAAAERNRQLNGVEQLVVVNAAVAAHTGSVVFGENLNGQVDDGTGGWGKRETAALSIDELARQHGQPDVLLIDVEGYECQALRGARRTLEQRPDCEIEVHQGIGLEAFGGSLEELVAYFPAEAYRLLVRAEDEDGDFQQLDEAALPRSRFPGGYPAGRAFLKPSTKPVKEVEPCSGRSR